MELVYEDQSGLLRRGCFDVHNNVGLGRCEEAYHQALLIWLRKQGIAFSSKSAHWITLTGEKVYCLQPDIVAWDSITIELKAVARQLRSTEFVQLHDYLKFRGDRLGLLINMGLDRVHVSRVLYQPKETELVEHWDAWRDHVDEQTRDIGLRIRIALQNIYSEHTTGYGMKVVSHLIPFALNQQGLSAVESPLAPTQYNGQQLPASPLDCLVIEDRIVLSYTALFDNNQFSTNRAASFLAPLNLKHAVAVNFGKNKAELQAIHRN